MERSRAIPPLSVLPHRSIISRNARSSPRDTAPCTWRRVEGDTGEMTKNVTHRTYFEIPRAETENTKANNMRLRKRTPSSGRRCPARMFVCCWVRPKTTVARGPFSTLLTEFRFEKVFLLLCRLLFWQKHSGLSRELLQQFRPDHAYLPQFQLSGGTLLVIVHLKLLFIYCFHRGRNTHLLGPICSQHIRRAASNEGRKHKATNATRRTCCAKVWVIPGGKEDVVLAALSIAENVAL